MSLITSGGSSFTNLNSSNSQSTNLNPQINSSTTTTNSQIQSSTTSSNEITLPTYDINDPGAMLKTLIRFIMRTFYNIPKSLVIEYIYHYERIKQQDLADRLCLDSKLIRSYIEEFKRNKFIIEDHHLESNDSTTGGRNQDQYYYQIDIARFIDVVNYRLIKMQLDVENFERQQTYKQLNYKCEQCSTEYTELNIGKLHDLTQDALFCSRCHGIVHEDIETREQATMSLFNEQLKPLFEILKVVERLNNVQQIKISTEQDLNGNNTILSSTNNHINKDLSTINIQRSLASSVFDRTAIINHDIQVIIEKDDDDHYSPMDINETSNTDSII